MAVVEKSAQELAWENSQHFATPPLVSVRNDTRGTTAEIAFQICLFSLLLATGDVLRGGTFVTQPQKLHTDDINQCLHNNSSSHWVPNTNLFNFTFLQGPIWPLWPFACQFENNRQNNATTSSSNQHLWLDSRQILHHQYGISVAESQRFLLMKHLQQREVRRYGCFPRVLQKFHADTSYGPHVRNIQAWNINESSIKISFQCQRMRLPL